MSVKYIQTGDAVDYTPGADVKSGDVVVQGELVGVAKLDIQTGKLGALAVTGLFDFPKATGAGTAIAAGTRVYWDAAEQVAKAHIIPLAEGRTSQEPDECEVCHENPGKPLHGRRSPICLDDHNARALR